MKKLFAFLILSSLLTFAVVALADTTPRPSFPGIFQPR